MVAAGAARGNALGPEVTLFPELSRARLPRLALPARRINKHLPGLLAQADDGALETSHEAISPLGLVSWKALHAERRFAPTLRILDQFVCSCRWTEVPGHVLSSRPMNGESVSSIPHISPVQSGSGDPRCRPMHARRCGASRESQLGDRSPLLAIIAVEPSPSRRCDQVCPWLSSTISVPSAASGP
jgi:hypothetical protein